MPTPPMVHRSRGRPLDGWTRTMRCGCRKQKHCSEQAALARAAADAQQYDAVVTVYRCTGSLAWHVTSHGFLEESLGSHARRLAYQLVLHPDGVFLDEFRERIVRVQRGGKSWSRVSRCARQMTELGVIRPRPPRDGGPPTGWYELVDERAARRIVQIGLDGYLEETGSSDV